MYTYFQFDTLSGSRLTLKKLEQTDFGEIIDNLSSPTTWAAAVRGISTPEKFKTYLNSFLDKQNLDQLLFLVAKIKTSGEIVAISAFHCASENFSKVEIGYTWIADKWQRTFVNTELKMLMLSYAFEQIKVMRVEFSVDPRNDKSNAAMKRIGAQFEGTLRKWRFLNEHDLGDRNIYSIIDDEWPAIKSHLSLMMTRE